VVAEVALVMTDFNLGIIVGAGIGVASLILAYYLRELILWLFKRRPW